MAPRETVKDASFGHTRFHKAVLIQGERTRSDQTDVAGGTADSATAMSAPARRPTVISSVPGTEYGAASSGSLRSRVAPPAREAGAPRRGRRGR